MVNQMYLAALVLGNAMASPVVRNGAMEARGDDVARAAALPERYSALAEPRLVWPPQKTRYWLGTDIVTGR